MRRACFVILLLLLFSPALADGWFAEQRLEIHPKYTDIQELNRLLGSLLPDVKYEVHENAIAAFGSSATLDLVQEFVKELDRPPDQIVFQVGVYEILNSKADEFLFRHPPVQTKTRRWGSAEATSIQLRAYSGSHPDLGLSMMTGQGYLKEVITKRLEEKVGSSGELKLPREASVALFGAKRAKLGVELKRADGPKVDTCLSVRTPKSRWQTCGLLRDGDPLLMTTQRSTKFFVVVTLYMMR